VEFRERLFATLRALAPVLREDVLIVGSEVPNLLPGPAVDLVVSQDVDIGVPVAVHPRVRERVRALAEFRRSPEEPSVLLGEGGLLEVNFVGIDGRLSSLEESYVLEDPELPLLVLGNLGLLRPGGRTEAGGLCLPLPEPTGLVLEKLLTERSGVKGERDLLVALALFARPGALDEAALRTRLGALGREQLELIRTNLALLSLMEPHAGMPDPVPHRELVRRLLRTVEELLGP
jgi:hypothetical protein